MSIIKDPELAKEGEKRVGWAIENMPALKVVYERLKESKALSGVRISMCLHITKETGAFTYFLVKLGAEVALAASNPLSTQDDVAAYLDSIGVEVFGWRGMESEDYYRMIANVISLNPDLVVDDGGDLHVLLHSKLKGYLDNVVGGTEETTTGVVRLRALEREGRLGYPVIAVNDTPTKRIIDNRFGTGQSVIDGLLRATSLLVAGKNVVVAGFGYVGRGVAERFRGMGARVIVTEVDPIKALEAHLSGFEVMTMDKASEVGDIFVTCTGMKGVIRWEHIDRMKDGVFLANAGHFNVEIDVDAIERHTRYKVQIRPYLTKHVLVNGKTVYLIGEGRLINLVAAEGHPPDVMMASFSNQMMSLAYLYENKGGLLNKVYQVPKEIDRLVASYILEGWGIEIDSLSEEQKKYGESWMA